MPRRNALQCDFTKHKQIFHNFDVLKWKQCMHPIIELNRCNKMLFIMLFIFIPICSDVDHFYLYSNIWGGGNDVLIQNIMELNRRKTII